MRSSLAMLIALTAAATAAETVLHVSPNGHDDAAGTLAAPLASLAGARDRIRALPQPRGPVTVLCAAGTYELATPLTLTAEDSGSAAAPVVYRAAPGAAVRLSAGRPVTDWQAVADPAILRRLAEDARTQVVVADLRAQGITDYGRLGVRGFSLGSPPAEAELFYDDEPMTLARWPNEGFRGVRKRLSDVLVEVDTDRLTRWVEEPEPWLFAYWHHDWAELYEPIAKIDAAAGTLERSAKVKAVYGVTPGRARWYGLNLLSELDSPGEYYLDRGAGRLYFWPPRAGGRALLSVGSGLVVATELAHVTFRGFVLEACRGTAVTISGGSDCHVVGCTIRNHGHRGVSVSGGKQHEVYGCDILHCGEGGITMHGGERRTLTPAGHNAENNHVHHYSRRCRTYKSAIAVSGVGNRIAHNLVHDGPHMALAAGGNDHIVEFNEIHNVVYESGDAGAYYVGRDWTQRGNLLRYNYWHQIVGATGHGGMTIYLDDQHCGHTIHGNLFERCSRAVFIGGGDDNTVTNNVFLDCWKAAHLDNRGMGWQKKATDAPDGELRTRLRAMPYQNELWAKRYPELVTILADDPGVPKRNRFARNLSAGGSWDDIHQGTRALQTVENNLVFDSDKAWITLERDAAGRPQRLQFKDPAAVAAIGFETLPVDKMGLYADERRASWPVQHLVRRVSLPEPEKPKAHAELPANPTFPVPRRSASLTLDGVLTAAEWGALDGTPALPLAVNYDGTPVDPPARAWLFHDGSALYIGVSAPLGAARNLGSAWGQSEAVEVALRAADGANADTLVLRGFAAGTFTMPNAAGAGEQSMARLQAGGVGYAAHIADDAWSAEWRLPLAALGVSPGDRVRCNLTVRRSAGGSWLMWRPTRGDSFLVERVGTLELAP